LLIGLAEKQMIFIHFVVLASLAMAQDVADDLQAVQKIELLGGKVERDHSRPLRQVIVISFAGSHRFGGEYLRLLNSFNKLQNLDLNRPQVTDADLGELARFRNLRSLILWRPQRGTSGGAPERKDLSLKPVRIAMRVWHFMKLVDSGYLRVYANPFQSYHCFGTACDSFDFQAAFFKTLRCVGPTHVTKTSGSSRNVIYLSHAGTNYRQRRRTTSKLQS
jgi:hypothetical protein